MMGSELMIFPSRTFAGLVTAFVIGLLSGAATAQTSTADWDAVIAAAKKEGRLTVYSGAVGQESTRKIGRLFEEKFGIPVTFLEARASELRERIRAEQASDRFLADVMFSSESQTQIILNDDKALVELPSVPNASRVRAELKTKAQMLPTTLTPYGILVNTTLVKPEDEPKSWHDLTDPKWKGKILADDTRAIGGGSLTFFATYLAFGREYHEKMAAQDIMFTRDQRLSHQRVARGEYAIYMPMTLPEVLPLKGLPVKAIIPSEGVTYVLYGNSQMRNAAHPNAAKLYINFALSDEAQLIYAMEGRGIAVQSVLDQVPPDLRQYGQAKLLGTSEPTRQDEMLRYAKEIYK